MGKIVVFRNDGKKDEKSFIMTVVNKEDSTCCEMWSTIFKERCNNRLLCACGINCCAGLWLYWCILPCLANPTREGGDCLSCCVYDWMKSTFPKGMRQVAYREVEESFHPCNLYKIYALSSFFYSFMGVYACLYRKEVEKKLPAAKMLLNYNILPGYFILQGFLSFWGDFYDMGRPSCANTVDLFGATWGVTVFIYLGIFERFDTVQKVLGLSAILHSACAFFFSRRYSSGTDMELFAKAHIHWHAVMPFWASLLFGVYSGSTYVLEPSPLEERSDRSFWTYICAPWACLVALNIIWKSICS